MGHCDPCIVQKRGLCRGCLGVIYDPANGSDMLLPGGSYEHLRYVIEG